MNCFFIVVYSFFIISKIIVGNPNIIPYVSGCVKVFIFKRFFIAVYSFFMLPAILGSAVYQFNQFMGTLLATFLPEGSVSWLYYADRLVQFPLGIFAIAISTAALPSLATEAAKKDLGQFQSTLNHALCLVFFITLPSISIFL